MTDEIDKRCLIVRAPCCGRVVIATSLRPNVYDRQTKMEVATLAGKGYTVETRPVEEVRQMPFGCHCKKEAA